MPQHRGEVGMGGWEDPHRCCGREGRVWEVEGKLGMGKIFEM